MPRPTTCACRGRCAAGSPRTTRRTPCAPARGRRSRPARPATAATSRASRRPWPRRSAARAHDGRRVKRIRVAAAVVWEGPMLLMTRRAPGGALGLQWEFPGGKIEHAETPEQAVVREVREELGVGATPHERLHHVTHDYSHGT